MKRHIKLVKTNLKPLKRDQRKNFTQKNVNKNLLKRFTGDAKKTWSGMKEIFRKCTTKASTLPIKSRNAACCNNSHDLLHVSFSLIISIFSVACI